MLRIFDPSTLRVPPPADRSDPPRRSRAKCPPPAPSCSDESIQFNQSAEDDEEHPYAERAADIRALFRSKAERAG